MKASEITSKAVAEFIKLDDVIANKIQGIDITKTYLLDEVEEGITTSNPHK